LLFGKFINTNLPEGSPKMEGNREYEKVAEAAIKTLAVGTRITELPSELIPGTRTILEKTETQYSLSPENVEYWKNAGVNGDLIEPNPTRWKLATYEVAIRTMAETVAISKRWNAKFGGNK
jgi:hypothetical protein